MPARRSNGQALLVIDMLNDFTLPGAPLHVPQNEKIIPRLKERIRWARENGIHVVYVNDAHDPDDREFRLWPPHAVKGTPGARVVDDVAPVRGDCVVEKKTYSGFFKTRLDKLLRSLGVKKLYITGCVANICVMFTASDAVLRGYEVEVFKDSVAALDPEEAEFAFRQMEKVMGAKVS